MDRAQYTTLEEVLNQVPDYRKRTGRQHRWMPLLNLSAVALASAQRTPQAIARWVCAHRGDLFAVLPPSGARLPSGATLRRARARLDVAAVEQALAAFHPPSAPEPTPTPIPAPLPGVEWSAHTVSARPLALDTRCARALWCRSRSRVCAHWPRR